MNTVAEERLMRAERVRQQEHYRKLLDQQVSYNRRSRDELPAPVAKPESYEQRYLRQQQLRSELGNEQRKYLPPIRQEEAGSYGSYGGNERMHSFRRQEEDRTQIYLKNCEEIIKNLRELKQKKERGHFPTMSTEPTNVDEGDIHSAEVQYYPKSTYFSSKGNVFNKQLPVEVRAKSKKKDLKSIEDSGDSNRQQIPINSNIRVSKSVPKKSSKVHRQYIVRQKQQQQKNPQSYDRTESQTPHGLSKIEARNYGSEKKNKLLNNGQQPKLYRTIEGNELPKERERNVESQRQEENRKVQKELSDCLLELTRYLKAQNPKKEEQANVPLNQSVIVQDDRRNNQVGSAPLSRGPYQDRLNSQAEQPLLNRNQMGSPKNVSNQKQVSFSPSLEANPQQNGNQPQINKNGSSNNRVRQLKQQAIAALKRLHQKSESFMNIVAHKNDKTQHQPIQKRLNSPINNTEFKQGQKFKSKEKFERERQFDNEQKPLKPVLSIPVTLGREAQEISSPKVSTNRNNQQFESNSELLNLMILHLQKQDSHNHQLTFCLRELTDYLKSQNEEMEMMRNSEIQGAIPVNNTESQKDVIEQEEDGEVQAKGDRSQSQKFQEAVLRKLKKARMKGNLFKQKVQKFKKQHPLVSIRLKPVKPSNVDGGQIKEQPQNLQEEDKQQVKDKIQQKLQEKKGEGVQNNQKG